MIIAGVTVIDTPLVHAAKNYARVHGDDMTFNHVMRSWLFGVIIYERLQSIGAFPPIDLEAHALSALLHDLGWDNTGELVSKDKCFEVDGAIAARSFIQEQGKNGKVGDWDEHRQQLVWDAIALHTSPRIAKYKEPVVQLCGLGIVSDFKGPDSDPTGILTWDDFNAVKKEFPRHDLAGGIREKIVHFCKTKPETTYGMSTLRVLWELTDTCADSWQMEYGRKYVEGYQASEQLGFTMIEASVAD
jgi:hypothetical protein